MNPKKLLKQAKESINDAKGVDTKVIDVREMTDITDYMVIVTGTSSRHVRAISKSVIDALRDEGIRPIGIEGEQHGQWVLLDYNDLLVHIMLRETREFYDLESHWRPSLLDASQTSLAGEIA